MEETLFYVFGIALVVAALVLSALGLRYEDFPRSRALLLGATGIVAFLVAGTTTFGVLNAREEQKHHEAELAAEEAEHAAEEPPAEEPSDGAPPPDGNGAQPAVDGVEVFNTAEPACGSCHTLAAADASGTVGPNLDDSLRGKPASFIEESIVDPGAEIAPGFPENVMPTTYGDSLSPEELAALVQLLSQGGGQQ
jgi:mono/diheme cytochrome c family protein